MAKRGWICAGCGRGSVAPEPWACPRCGKEICDSCGWILAHCRRCSEGKTESELMRAANSAGWDFTGYDAVKD
jgi:hypothetical protein